MTSPLEKFKRLDNFVPASGGGKKAKTIQAGLVNALSEQLKIAEDKNHAPISVSKYTKKDGKFGTFDVSVEATFVRAASGVYEVPLKLGRKFLQDSGKPIAWSAKNQTELVELYKALIAAAEAGDFNGAIKQAYPGRGPSA